MYIDLLPDELIEYIFMFVHQQKYKEVMIEMVRHYNLKNDVDIIIENFINEIINNAITQNTNLQIT